MGLYPSTTTIASNISNYSTMFLIRFLSLYFGFLRVIRPSKSIPPYFSPSLFQQIWQWIVLHIFRVLQRTYNAITSTGYNWKKIDKLLSAIYMPEKTYKRLILARFNFVEGDQKIEWIFTNFLLFRRLVLQFSWFYWKASRNNLV